MSGLVEDPVETEGLWSGLGLVDDLTTMRDQLLSGDLIGSELSGIALVGDGVEVVLDPLGTLASWGLAWLIDNMDPVRGWFDNLTGDHDAVRAHAGTWANVADRVAQCADDLRDRVRSDLASMHGLAIEAYRAYTAAFATVTKAVGGVTRAASWALGEFANVIQAVHDLVRDALSDIIGAVGAALVRVALTVGASTLELIATVTRKVAVHASRLGRLLGELARAMSALAAVLKRLADLIPDVTRGLSSASERLIAILREGRPNGWDVPTVVTPFLPEPAGAGRGGGVCAST